MIGIFQPAARLKGGLTSASFIVAFAGFGLFLAQRAHSSADDHSFLFVDKNKSNDLARFGGENWQAVIVSIDKHLIIDFPTHGCLFQSTRIDSNDTRRIGMSDENIANRIR
jgi:hypothetical protein